MSFCSIILAFRQVQNINTAATSLYVYTSLYVSVPFFLSGSLSSRSLPLPCWLQVELARKDPSRTKEVRLASKEAVTPHSFSLRCFLSRQAAKAQPTAWLSRSPWQSRGEVHVTYCLVSKRSQAFEIEGCVSIQGHRPKTPWTRRTDLICSAQFHLLLLNLHSVSFALFLRQLCPAQNLWRRLQN